MSSTVNINLLDVQDKPKKQSQWFFKLAMTCLLFVLGVITIIPFIYMLSSSFKVEIDIYKYPVEWIPKVIKNNYHQVWFGNYNFARYYLNSLFVTACCIIGLLVTSSLAAYGFSRMEFKFRDGLFLLYLSTMMIPPQVTIVPRFILYKFMGIYDTHLALILPGIFTAFGTFLMRQFMVALPKELNESAKIDGAGEFKTWFHIVAPLTKPAMMTLALIAMVWSWNDYENALIFLKTTSLYTIPVGLISFMDETGKMYSLITAAAVSATVPLVLLFLAGQRYFIEGLTAGGVKG